MKTIIIIFAALFGMSTIGYAQMKLHSFEEVDQLMAENPKPIFVFLNTSWCKYCKIMENTTFKNKEVIEKLNAVFYFVSFDAESKKDVYFHGRRYKFLPTGHNSGVHELALELVENSQPIYPAITILDPSYNILLQKASLLDAQMLLSLLDVIQPPN